MRPTRAKRGNSRRRRALPTFLDDRPRWRPRARGPGNGSRGGKARKPTAAEVAAELRRLDETLHNIEGCILQLQGKLLTRG